MIDQVEQGLDTGELESPLTLSGLPPSFPFFEESREQKADSSGFFVGGSIKVSTTSTPLKSTGTRRKLGSLSTRVG